MYLDIRGRPCSKRNGSVTLHTTWMSTYLRISLVCGGTYNLCNWIIQSTQEDQIVSGLLKALGNTLQLRLQHPIQQTNSLQLPNANLGGMGATAMQVFLSVATASRRTIDHSQTTTSWVKKTTIYAPYVKEIWKPLFISLSSAPSRKLYRNSWQLRATVPTCTHLDGLKRAN